MGDDPENFPFFGDIFPSEATPGECFLERRNSFEECKKRRKNIFS
jgi:hypothetical protein